MMMINYLYESIAFALASAMELVFLVVGVISGPGQNIPDVHIFNLNKNKTLASPLYKKLAC